MTCKDCLYEPQCILRISYGMGDDDDKELTDMENRCKPFRNKADYAEVKRGVWVQDKHWQYDYKCSICGEYACEGNYGNNDNLTDYCPNCGAKMKGGAEC